MSYMTKDSCDNLTQHNRKLSRYLLSILVIILLASWLPLASLMVVLSPPVTHFLAENTVDTQNSQLPREYLVHIADETRAFSVGDDNVDLPIADGKGDSVDQSREFPTDVISHLLDVRAVFIGCMVAFVAASALLVIVVISAILWRKIVFLGFPMMVAAATSLTITTLLVLIGIANFSLLFTKMHEIFFAEGSWIFAYDSLLICALPEPFWVGCAIVWALSLLLLCVMCLIVGKILTTKRDCEMSST